MEDNSQPLWTEEQVKNLEKWQACSSFHPLTCCSHNGCKRNEQPNWGKLIPTREGLVCPCGQYKQTWASETSLNTEPPENPWGFLKQ